ncbi:hypothetical protein [Lactococcus termiticola]|uniref:Uncharacterized protein n=1 Tax=Lactococcus termiticola TaxID=2169526 RepID=A0A2R5HDI0_9LACT|nr:hypothetical protein [Lactococcus termiticola]GBG96123.1 hypothetical protein NtB2_00227 [Lactococcus termiticola]
MMKKKITKKVEKTKCCWLARGMSLTVTVALLLSGPDIGYGLSTTATPTADVTPQESAPQKDKENKPEKPSGQEKNEVKPDEKEAQPSKQATSSEQETTKTEPKAPSPVTPSPGLPSQDAPSSSPPVTFSKNINKRAIPNNFKGVDRDILGKPKSKEKWMNLKVEGGYLVGTNNAGEKLTFRR